jgi:hypothetical protein
VAHADATLEICSVFRGTCDITCIISVVVFGIAEAKIKAKNKAKALEKEDLEKIGKRVEGWRHRQWSHEQTIKEPAQGKAQLKDISNQYRQQLLQS